MALRCRGATAPSPSLLNSAPAYVIQPHPLNNLPLPTTIFLFIVIFFV
jgi:hypothetical protein